MQHAELHSHADRAHRLLEQATEAILTTVDSTPKDVATISHQTGIDTATTSAILDELVKHGAVMRHVPMGGSAGIASYTRMRPDEQRQVHSAPI